MKTGIAYGRRGRALSDADREEIIRLCHEWTTPTAGKIARRLGRKHGTVYWFMLTRNLIDTKSTFIHDYERNGINVRAYTAEEDARLLGLRSTLDDRGKPTPYRVIAAALEKEFGRPRTSHSVQVRNIILSTRIDDEDAHANA